MHQTLAQRPDMTKVTLPPAAFPWAEDVTDEWIEWVRGSGIDVIGDVEDLRPVPPPPTGAGSTPTARAAPRWSTPPSTRWWCWRWRRPSGRTRTSSSARGSAGPPGGCDPGDARERRRLVVDRAAALGRQHAVVRLAAAGRDADAPADRPPAGRPPARPQLELVRRLAAAAGDGPPARRSPGSPTWC